MDSTALRLPNAGLRLLRNLRPAVLPLLLLIHALLLLSTGAGATELTLKQQILMPGPLIAGHAKFEADCESCHTPFAKGGLTERCLKCHEDIAADRNNKQGFHGIAPAAQSSACDICHTDHEGRDADISGLLKESFNHQHTDFVLEGTHATLKCSSCHKPGKSWREAPQACVACHEDDDPHQGVLGKECQVCHQATRWTQRLPFDHSSTAFALHGRHSDVPCSSCHIAQQYQFADQRCINCHRANDVHAGSNGEDCASCHSEAAWDQVRFDHNSTDFPLRGGHADIPCVACHASGRPAQKTATTCKACHSNDDIHLGSYGSECQLCHSEAAWGKVTFNHAHDTDFPLTGKHQALNCGQCHGGALTDSLPRDCAGCHRADDVHNDPGMALCGTCHSTQSWQAISQFDHDSSQFPLLGMHRVVPCQHCHIGNQFTLNDQRCVSCHRQDDKHQASLGEDCGQCHTPNSWAVWQFDHNRQTQFKLTGKHQGLECSACHAGHSGPTEASRLCGSCHRRQDIHNGEFGTRCDRCHNTNNFFELTIE